jgi:hypothetical protein
MRRYSWKTLLLGAAISVFLFTLPFFSQIFSRTFVASLEVIIQSIFPKAVLQWTFLGTFTDFLCLLPFLIAIVIFAVEARTGYTLRGPGLDALYLPRKFREAITFIRSVQDGGSCEKEPRTNPREEQTG